jgi:hypothetical protein
MSATEILLIDKLYFKSACADKLKNSKKSASGFESKKQAVLGQTSRFFEFDAVHRAKKMANSC